MVLIATSPCYIRNQFPHLLILSIHVSFSPAHRLQKHILLSPLSFPQPPLPGLIINALDGGEGVRPNRVSNVIEFLLATMVAYSIGPAQFKNSWKYPRWKYVDFMK